MTGRLVLLIGTLALAASPAAAQQRPEGGAIYSISHWVIAGGGGTSSDTNRSLEGTIGQGVAGTTSAGGQYSLHGGFWYPDAGAPTAATASITGRINNSYELGRLRRSVRIILTDPSTGEERVASIGKIGRYRFDGVEVGRAYILRAEGRGVTFEPESRVINLLDNMADVDFTAVLQQ